LDDKAKEWYVYCLYHFLFEVVVHFLLLQNQWLKPLLRLQYFLCNCVCLVQGLLCRSLLFWIFSLLSMLYFSKSKFFHNRIQNYKMLFFYLFLIFMLFFFYYTFFKILLNHYHIVYWFTLASRQIFFLWRRKFKFSRIKLYRKLDSGSIKDAFTNFWTHKLSALQKRLSHFNFLSLFIQNMCLVFLLIKLH
jgi:hypothetical protein